MKKGVAFLLVFVLALSFAACGSSNEAVLSADSNTQAPVQEEPVQEEPQPEAETTKTPKTVDDIANALGLTGKSEVWFAMIGASDGAEFNDGSIELYIYDNTDADQYKGFSENKGMYGTAFVNDGVVLVFLDGIEPDQDLVDAFRALVFEEA